MDESMEDEDSLLSSSNYYPTRRSRAPASPAAPTGRNHPEASFDYPVRAGQHQYPWRVPEEVSDDEEDELERAAEAGGEEAEEEEGEEGEEEEEEEEEYAQSETSSVMFDPDADPEGFAKRLDELAGCKEIGEEEMRALKWGPPIARGPDGKLPHVPLPIDTFRKVLDHYLSSTEWKYANTPGMSWDHIGPKDGIEGGLMGMGFENHPISVFGKHADRDSGEDDGLGIGVRVTSALGIEGLPSMTRYSQMVKHAVSTVLLSRRSRKLIALLVLLILVVMRGYLVGRGLGVVVVTAIALQGIQAIPTARGVAVIPRGSSPFLIGPPDEVVAPSSNDKNDDNDNDKTTTTHATHKSHTETSTSTSADSSTSTTSSSQTSTSSSTSTSTSSASASASPASTDPPRPPEADAPRQPASIKYLVPVFLFILISLGGWLFSRWYAKRKVDEYEEQEYERGKWKQLKEEDEKDPWYSGDSDRDAEEVHWQDVDLVPAQSSGAISAAGRGWGWRSTVNAWKSARGKAAMHGEEEETDEMGQRRTTMRLVSAVPPSATYQTLPDLSGRPIETIQEERGSIRALRDKIASLTYRDRDQTPRGKLDRNRAPNKRRSQRVAPPEAPAWIQPRATSPTQALSPPMQPHLFFHPTPSGQSLHGILGHTAGSESGSDYGSEDESHMSKSRSNNGINGLHGKYPTIPSTASALASSYTAVPLRSPRKAGSRGSTDSVVDGDTGEPDPHKTPTRRSQLMRTSTTPAPLTPKSTMRRSTATANLADTPISKLGRSATTRPRSGLSSGLSPPSAKPKRTKTKAQKKAEKAHDKVEDILKASWSDRALASPTSCMSLDGAVAGVQAGEAGSRSPGVEEAAVFSGMGGGIEQRLAMLQKVEV